MVINRCRAKRLSGEGIWYPTVCTLYGTFLIRRTYGFLDGYYCICYIILQTDGGKLMYTAEFCHGVAITLRSHLHMSCSIPSPHLPPIFQVVVLPEHPAHQIRPAASRVPVTILR